MDVWNSFKSDYILKLYGASYLAESPFVVTEFCDQGNLVTFLEENESDRQAYALILLSEATRGLIQMHTKQIVHGDLKCDNILVKNGQAKVCDFDTSFKIVTKQISSLRITHAIPWKAPECHGDEPSLPTLASDVYAFGMTIYEALTSETPYGDCLASDEVVNLIRKGILPDRTDKIDDDEIWSLIEDACAFEPDQSCSIADLKERLNDLANRTGVSVRRRSSSADAKANSPLRQKSSPTINRSSTSPKKILGKSKSLAPVEEQSFDIILQETDENEEEEDKLSKAVAPKHFTKTHSQPTVHHSSVVMTTIAPPSVPLGPPSPSGQRPSGQPVSTSVPLGPPSPTGPTMQQSSGSPYLPMRPLQQPLGPSGQQPTLPSGQQPLGPPTPVPYTKVMDIYLQKTEPFSSVPVPHAYPNLVLSTMHLSRHRI